MKGNLEALKKQNKVVLKEIWKWVEGHYKRTRTLRIALTTISKIWCNVWIRLHQDTRKNLNHYQSIESFLRMIIVYWRWLAIWWLFIKITNDGSTMIPSYSSPKTTSPPLCSASPRCYTWQKATNISLAVWSKADWTSALSQASSLLFGMYMARSLSNQRSCPGRLYGSWEKVSAWSYCGASVWAFAWICFEGCWLCSFGFIGRLFGCGGRTALSCSWPKLLTIIFQLW